MQCQFCRRETVDKIFYIKSRDAVYQIPVCNDCLQKRWKIAVSSGQAEEFKKRTGWRPGQPEPRHLGDQTFPELAAEGLRTRRRLLALHTLLDEATRQEHYEEAARLRDNIAVLEGRREQHGN